MFCPDCGTSNPNDARFCSGCGRNLSDVAAKTSISSETVSTTPAAQGPTASVDASGRSAASPTTPPHISARNGNNASAASRRIQHVVLAIGLFLVVALIIGKIGSTSSDSSSSDGASGQCVADSCVVDDVDYSIMDTQITDSIGGNEYEQPTRPSGRFIILRLLAQNNSHESKEISLSAAKLEDADGNSYSTSSEGETALSMKGDSEAEFLLSQVQPQLSKTVKIVFDVPTGETHFTLVIPHSMFSGGEDGRMQVSL